MFKSAIQQITVPKILSMKEVKCWLNETRETYHLACIEQEKSQNDLVRLPNGVEIKRTFFDDETPDFLLLMDLYQTLDKLADYHKYEPYFKKQLEHYQSIKESRELVQSWLRKNMYLGNEKFLIFEFEYLSDYENDKFSVDSCPLQPEFIHFSDLTMYIKRQNFLSTLTFVSLFHELFYNQKMLPNTIERIQSDFPEFTKSRLN